jgi:hypothetical protein
MSAPLRRCVCGPWSFLFSPADGAVRHLRAGGTELLLGLYAAVRDHNWDTVTPRLEDLVIEESPGRVQVRFRAVCHADPVDFAWDGAIAVEAGAAGGRLVYSFRGYARSAFRRNRIGFCVLHGAGCAGRPVRVETTAGGVRSAEFPAAISPHQPFFDLRALTHEPRPGLTLTVRMEGDTFEMEDQRNWTDASFKTYCTPLGRPFPVMVPAGTVIEQRIEIVAEGAAPAAIESSEHSTVTVRPVAGARAVPLPAIGLGSAALDEPAPQPAEIAWLRSLGPAHLRVDLAPADPQAPEVWQRGLAEAAALDAALEIAVHLSDNAAAELQRVATWAAGAPVVRWLVFHRSEKSTTAPWLELARAPLRAAAPTAAIVGGTDAYFAELNRGRPPVAVCDAVTFSINPQVHAFDELSLLETLPMQAEVVRNARAFSGGRPVGVSPVTLRPRFNPNATGPEPAPVPGALPAAVDPRQRTPFAALWTLGSLKHLAEAGAAWVTFYRTFGWMGLAEPAALPPGARPEAFPSTPGERFPLAEVFRACAPFREGVVWPVDSSDSLRVEALLLAHGARRRLLLAHFAAEPTTVALTVPGSARAAVTALLPTEPAAIGESTVTLPPGALVQLDWTD